MTLEGSKDAEDSKAAIEVAEKQQRLSSQAKSRVSAAASLAYALSFLVALAVVLSLPFPFVRRLWIKEIWGYYGLINALCFFVIANRLNHRNVAFAFGGLGLLIYDQTRNLHGFWYVGTHDGIQLGTLTYMLLSLTIATLFLLIFCKAIQAIYRYQVFKRDQLQLYATETYPSRQKRVLLELAIPALLYVGLGSLTHTVAKLEPIRAFGILRIIGGTVFFGGFLMIGHTLDCFFRNRRSRTETSLNITFHAIALILIQGTIFHLTPLSALIRS